MFYVGFFFCCSKFITCVESGLLKVWEGEESQVSHRDKLTCLSSSDFSLEEVV